MLLSGRFTPPKKNMVIATRVSRVSGGRKEKLVKSKLVILAAMVLVATPQGRYCLSWSYASICCVLSGRNLENEAPELAARSSC